MSGTPGTYYTEKTRSRSLLILNCDRFVIEIIAVKFQPSKQHKTQLDFYYHTQCKTEELTLVLDKVEKPEYILCRFPLESYIGSILGEKFPNSAYDLAKVAIASSLESFSAEQLLEYEKRLSFQYLDRRIVFSDARYCSRIEKATLPNGTRSDYEQSLIESTAIAYRFAWLYYKSLKGSVGVWTF